MSAPCIGAGLQLAQALESGSAAACSQCGRVRRVFVTYELGGGRTRLCSMACETDYFEPRAAERLGRREFGDGA